MASSEVEIANLVYRYAEFIDSGDLEGAAALFTHARIKTATGEIGHEELERRLLEMGFVEGARFQVLHEGLVGRDPIALRLDDTRVALRRREAHAILIDCDNTP